MLSTFIYNIKHTFTMITSSGYSFYLVGVTNECVT